MDNILKKELEPIYIDIPGSYTTFFRGMADLETTSKVVFRKCGEESNPLYYEESGETDGPKTQSRKTS